jgi:hypothetical protein
VRDIDKIACRRTFGVGNISLGSLLVTVKTRPSPNLRRRSRRCVSYRIISCTPLPSLPYNQTRYHTSRHATPRRCRHRDIPQTGNRSWRCIMRCLPTEGGAKRTNPSTERAPGHCTHIAGRGSRVGRRGWEWMGPGSFCVRRICMWRFCVGAGANGEAVARARPRVFVSSCIWY